MTRLRTYLDKMNGLSASTQSYLLVASAFMLLLLRRPTDLFTGYFYAEEGSTYFHYAWNSTIANALLAPHQGYYSLYPNIAMLIAARWLPAQDAAAFGAWCDLLVIILLAYIVAQCDLFRSFEERGLAVIVSLFAAPGLTMMLSTINSQYYLALSVALLLVSSTSHPEWLRRAVLVVGGFTGVVSCLFAPFYVAKAIVEKSRRHLAEAGILVLCSAVQGMIIWHMARATNAAVAPHHTVLLLVDTFVLSSPVMEFMSRAAWHLGVRYLVSHHSLLLWSIIAVLGIAGMTGLTRVLSRVGGSPAVWLTMMAFFSAILSLLGGIGASDAFLMGSARYLLVCNVLIGLSIVFCLFRIQGKLRSVFVFLISALILSGVVDLPTYWRSVRCEPSWPVQIAEWRSNDRMELRAGPHDWGHPFMLAHQHPNSMLPSYIYDSIVARRPVGQRPTPSPCKT